MGNSEGKGWKENDPLREQAGSVLLPRFGQVGPEGAGGCPDGCPDGWPSSGTGFPCGE